MRTGHSRWLVLMVIAPALLGAQAAAPPALTVSGIEQAVKPGAVLQVTVTGAAALETVTGRALGQHVSFYRRPDGMSWTGLIGVDLETKPGKYPLRITAARTGEPALSADGELHVATRVFPTRRLRVASRFVDPPPAEIERIKQEADRLATIFSPITPKRWDGPFIVPVGGTPSSNFGSRSVYNGQPRSPHAGVDFGGETGTPIVSPGAGQVVLAEDLFFTGQTVIVDHGLGLYSLFAHLSRIDVTVTQPVARHQVVGLLGATGRVTAAHLHWAVRLNDARVDPMSLVKILP